MTLTRNVPAIAGLFFRHCLRTRLVLAVTILIACIVLAVPAYVDGDGTTDGRIRIVLFYTLGLVSIVLSVVSLWSACAAIPIELESRRLHLVLSKPVRRLEIWVGTWFGLLALNALLLAVAAGVIYLQVQRVLAGATRDGGETPVLVGRRLARPIETVTAELVQAEIDARRRSGHITANVEDRDFFPAIEYELNVRAGTVQTGQTGRWEFMLPNRLKNNGALQLRFKFASSGMNDAPRTGTWTFGTRSEPALHHLSGTWTPFQYHDLAVPMEPPDALIVVQFENPLLGEGGAVIFEVEDGIVLLNHESGFLTNYFRAVLVIFLELAFLAALGLSAGSLFSQPVAVFVSYTLLMMAGLAQYLGIALVEDPNLPILYDPLPVPLINAFVEQVARISHAVTEPITQFNVLSRLSQGILVPWSLVRNALFVLIGGYSVTLGIFGVLVFHRREIGLPRI
ncbi:MAG: hypothetical protein O2923_01670 [Verrucomicrobia bacterium]|nr:hypothetical protein [Verrucomicrobiota bacterium]MDA1085675.1 hypothetical protein [Verrucomicrobiota bacterium]